MGITDVIRQGTRICSMALTALLLMQGLTAQPIDRQALVRRHTVQVSAPDTLSSLSFGNGAFAFTVDATGLQSFPDEYAAGIPLTTESYWGWHSFPDTDHYLLKECFRSYDFNGAAATLRGAMKRRPTGIGR
jgi:hypothetical protein